MPHKFDATMKYLAEERLADDDRQTPAVQIGQHAGGDLKKEDGSFDDSPHQHQLERIEVPTACADFPREVIWSPRRWLEPRFNITRWTEMPRGGHFAAMEQPALLVDDIRAFFRGLR